MTRTIDNTQDVLDSRDVIERLEELQGERQDLLDIFNDCEEGSEERQDADQALKDWDEDNGEELASLRQLNEEGEQVAEDWIHGATLVRESYWVEFVEEDLKELGYLPKDLPHWIEIDWERTAENVRQDYSTVDFGGVDYYVR